MKIAKIAMVVGIILVLASTIAFQYFFRSAVPDYTGTETVKGLTAPVEVKTDGHGIPHLFARNEADLFFAQGYIMARERLFQMDITRLAGRGELSTLFGDRTVEKDRFLKTVGFYRKARASYPLLLQETREALQAFSKGVNAYIETAGHLPREYFFLKAKPQPWVPEDSIVVASLMAYNLTRSKKIDLVLHNIREKAGDDFLEQIIPDYPDFAPTLAAGGGIAGNADTIHPRPTNLASRSGSIGFADDFPFPLEIAASNWMLFSGRMTDTGQAMFAGSPDLAPTLPALFYVMHLKGGDIDAMGGVLPGVPSLGPLGYNGAMAFSAVNGRGDELDYFIEKINPDNPSQYLTENGYRDFTTIHDEIRIKTKEGLKTEKITIRISRHGPMISGVLPGAPPDCAMQWAALDLPNRDIDGLIKLVKARNFAEFRTALSFVKTINLNVGYADNAGNIGWQFTASPPIRKKGNGTLPAAGWTGEHDWIGFIPFDALPHDLNPKSGYVGSFNNDPGNVDYHLTNFYLFERAMRFRQIMEARAGKKVTFDALKRMQMDTVSVVAQRWVPVMLSACEGDRAMEPCTKLFRNWDYKIETGSAAATLFNDVYYRLMGNTLKDEIGTTLWEKNLGRQYLYYVPDLVLTRLVDQPGHLLFDDVTTPETRENRDDIIRRSMHEAIGSLKARLGTDTTDWQWGKLHKMAFDHPLGSKLSFLNLKPVPTHGSHHTINSGFWDSEKPFNMSSGGVIRIMVDFAHPERSTIISPPGQSGHYMSPFYDDMVDTWADGDQVPMQFFTAKALPETLKLLPAN
jgi:penicillin G amidase